VIQAGLQLTVLFIRTVGRRTQGGFWQHSEAFVDRIQAGSKKLRKQSIKFSLSLFASGCRCRSPRPFRRSNISFSPVEPQANSCIISVMRILSVLRRGFRLGRESPVPKYLYAPPRDGARIRVPHKVWPFRGRKSVRGRANRGAVWASFEGEACHRLRQSEAADMTNHDSRNVRLRRCT
jgi:hypothetical protein